MKVKNLIDIIKGHKEFILDTVSDNKFYCYEISNQKDFVFLEVSSIKDEDDINKEDILSFLEESNPETEVRAGWELVYSDEVYSTPIIINSNYKAQLVA